MHTTHCVWVVFTRFKITKIKHYEKRILRGAKVVCISENFPVIKEYGGTGKEATNTPNKEEVLVIDEILNKKVDTRERDIESLLKDDQQLAVLGVIKSALELIETSCCNMLPPSPTTGSPCNDFNFLHASNPFIMGMSKSKIMTS